MNDEYHSLQSSNLRPIRREAAVGVWLDWGKTFKGNNEMKEKNGTLTFFLRFEGRTGLGFSLQCGHLAPSTLSGMSNRISTVTVDLYAER